MSLSTPIRRGVAGLALGLACMVPAMAQKPLDFVLGGMPPRETAGEPLVFRIAEYSALQLVPREPGGEVNQHPRTIDPAVLRQQLLQLKVLDSKGDAEALFGDDEAQEISGPLAKALAAAKPQQDVLLFSSSRRSGFMLTPPVGLSARLFVANDRLNVIVEQPRIDYYGQWRTNRSIRPELKFGSRTAASTTRLAASPGLLVRNDWAALPLVAAASVAAPAPAPAAVSAAPAPVAAPVAPPAPAAAPATVPAGGDAETRLRTLKRLRDTGLITEDEYQQKRTEVLKTL